MRVDLKSVGYQGKNYRTGVLEIDEAKREAQILLQKRGFMSRGLTPLATFRYGAETTIQVKGDTLWIDGTALQLENDQAAGAVAKTFSAPGEEARKREEEEDLRRALETIRDFLMLRAEMLSLASSLRTDPREAVLRAHKEEAEVPGDPYADPLGPYQSRLSDALSKVNSALDGKVNRINPQRVQLLYSTTYLIGFLQEAIFEGNEQRVKKSIDLLSSLGVKEGDLKALRLEEMTDRLLETSFGMWARQGSLPGPIQG